MCWVPIAVHFTQSAPCCFRITPAGSHGANPVRGLSGVEREMPDRDAIGPPPKRRSGGPPRRGQEQGKLFACSAKTKVWTPGASPTTALPGALGR